MEETCLQLQNDEIEVLESIYPGLFSIGEDHGNGRIISMDIPIILASPTTVDLIPAFSRGVSNGESSTSKTLNHPDLTISHLPSLSARISLPSRYPLEASAKVVSLRAGLSKEERSNWLPRSALSAIQAKLEQMWEEEKGVVGEGSGVLWRWWEWVGTGEFLADLGMLKGGKLRLSIPPTLPVSTFHTLLKTHNAAQIHSSFEQTAFACTICFESRKGKSCVQMPCGCVFCNPCLQACWSLAISEGTLEAVSCPSPACVKRRATREGRLTVGDSSGELDPVLVESVVGLDMRERWEELKDRRRAEIDPSYCICPQPKCQAAVPPPPLPSASDALAQEAISRRAIRLSSTSSPSNSSSSPLTTPATSTTTIPPEDRWARYRQCPKCHFSFCLYCSATWHGPHTPCSFPQTSLIVLEYLSYPENSPERLRMEQRRGKTNLERMVRKYIEDEENKKWLEERTRACSGCGVRVEKSHGCNHMTCGRCGAHFCYRCGDSLRPTDPYAHYRKPGSCFERLFDQEEIARFERETAMQQGGIMDLAAVAGAYGDEWGPRDLWHW